jgi:hypothetical protein
MPVSIYILVRGPNIAGLHEWIDVTGAGNQGYHVPYDSIEITDSLKVKADSLSFDLWIKGWSLTKPLAGQNVYVDSDAGLEFAGVIETVTSKQIAPNLFRHSCECTDYTIFLDRKLVVQVYDPDTLTAGAIIKDILQNYCTEDFYRDPYTKDPNTMHIKDGYTLTEKNFDYQEVSSCFDEIAEEIGYQWWIEPRKWTHPITGRLYILKDVYFDNTHIRSSPLPLGVLAPDETSSITHYYDLEVSESISRVKNRIYGKDFKIADSAQTTSTFTEQKYGPFVLGSKPFFPASATIDWGYWMSATIRNISDDSLVSTLTTIKKFGVDPDVPVYPTDPGTDSSMLFVDADTSTVWLPSVRPLALGEKLVVLYYRADEGIDVDQKSSSITELKEREGHFSDGIHEFAISIPEVQSSTDRKEVFSRMERVLQSYASIDVSGSFRSRLSGWRSGQVFLLQSPRLGRWEGSVNRPLSEPCWVQRVTKRVLGDGTLESEIHFNNEFFAP